MLVGELVYKAVHLHALYQGLTGTLPATAPHGIGQHIAQLVVDVSL